MRRVMTRRRRIAAALLLPGVIAATSTGTALAGEPSARVSDRSVTVGQRIVIQGEAPGSRNSKVQIRFRQAGKEYFETVKGVSTGPQGGFSVPVTAHRSGFWAVKTRKGNQSAGDLVKVRSRIKVTAEDHEMFGDSVRIKGYVRPGDFGRKVKIDAGNEEITTRTGKDGRFAVSWTPDSTGDYRIWVTAKGNKIAARSRDRGPKVSIFRPVGASWYGPGLYGNTTACGQTLTSTIVGVAHRTLPCGTKMTLRYGDNEVVARVIDRGPFHGSRELDLTYATKEKLGFGDVGTVLMTR